MQSNDIEKVSADVLAKMDANGFYLLPIGFNCEPLTTQLHLAFRQLRDADAIRFDGMHCGFEKWIRS